MTLLATVIIPTYGRAALVSRAVESVLAGEGASEVEILVIDDCSPEPVRCPLLREQDRVIRLNRNSGGAVARNAGIDAARGNLIYLLDSDDIFLQRNFIRDSGLCEEGFVYFCDREGVSSDCEELTAENFWSQILVKNEGVAQTSTLSFRKSDALRFDEMLPKHQDWDFIYCSAIRNGFRVVRGAGLVKVDKGDRKSVSRALHPEKSDPWFEKLKQLDTNSLDWIEFQLYCKYPERIAWRNFLCQAAAFSCRGDVKLSTVFKRFIQRALCHL